MTRQAFLGIDVGTQGVRVMAIDGKGDLIAAHRSPFQMITKWEQDPEVWWRSTMASLRAVAIQLQANQQVEPFSLTISGTSGTILPLGEGHLPVHPALMYHDPRSRNMAEAINDRFGLHVNTSWSLPKMLWFREAFPEPAHLVRHWRHPTDFIIGRLTGIWNLTDETSALKTGYDPVAGSWPLELFSALHIDPASLPNVTRSGTPIGHVLPAIAAGTGLPRELIVTTGMTDGCATQVASGAVFPGSWNTTIGTTMVIKGTLREPIHDDHHRIYTHRHPDGLWMAGGASNTGAAWISTDYPDDDLASLNAEALRLTPTGAMFYPLRMRSERFPFLAPDAIGFETEGLDPATRFTAGLEGVAFLERMAYGLLEELSGTPISSIVSSGGGNQSEAWMQIRSNVMNRPIARVRHAEGAVGAAIIGASRTAYSSLIEATAHLTQRDGTVQPTDTHRGAYDFAYQRFVFELRNRAYLTAQEMR